MSQVPYVYFGWKAIQGIFLALGGFAGVSKIFEWLFRGPRIIGEVEQRALGTMHDLKSQEFKGTLMVVQYYLVNTRVQPTTIRGMKIEARLSSGEWIQAEQYAIPSDFSLPNVQVDFKSADLYERIGTELLEYGKGVRGWILLQFAGIEQVKLQKSTLRTELTDAFGKKHTLHDKYKPTARPVLGYYPGAGIGGHQAASSTSRPNNSTISSTSHT